MGLNGAVYNVTHYMDFHPGGWEELIKGVGKDATDMFNEVHKWVNYQSLLEACLVGKLVDGPAETVMTPPKLPPPVLQPPGDTGDTSDTRDIRFCEGHRSCQVSSSSIAPGCWAFGIV